MQGKSVNLRLVNDIQTPYWMNLYQTSKTDRKQNKVK